MTHQPEGHAVAIQAALENLIAVLEAHEVATRDCDDSGRTFCDCIDRAKKRASDALDRFYQLEQQIAAEEARRA